MEFIPRSGRLVQALALVGAVSLLSGCGSSALSPLVSGKQAGDADVVPGDACGTTYEIFVYSFADSDGDGIGDLNGIAENLDYLNDGDPKTRDDLGVNALWLTPIFPSPTYHKYDATDYCAIDQEFGTMEDFDALLDACHTRGMRLYLDLAVNHTSVEHPWFTEAADTLRALPADADADAADSPYVDYYNFSKEPQTGYEPLYGADGVTESGWFYEARFWSGMPDLNLDSAAVRSEIADIAHFWLERGVDGFRLDAVTSYYTDDQEQSRAFLAWFNSAVKEIAPDAYLVGEAWESQNAYAKLYASGVDSFFDFAFAGQEGTIAQVVRNGKNGSKFASAMAGEEALYASYSADYLNAPFYTNHDMARSAGYYAKDGENRTKLAFAMNLLQTGNAFIYYGEELGMRGSGKDENKRAPFPWADAGEEATLSQITIDARHLCAGPPEMDDFDAAPYGTLAVQTDDPCSVARYCREAIHLRARHPLIARGRTVLPDESAVIAQELAAHPAVCLFLRERGGEGSEATGDDTEALWIFINTGAEAQTIALGRDTGDGWTLLDSLTVDETSVQFTGGGGDTLILPGYAVAVLEPDAT